MKKLSSVLLLLLLLISTFGFGQTNATRLTRSLENLQQKSDFPGFAVAVVDEGGILYERGFGFADLKKRTPYTAQMIQPVGSVSKTFIGAALMKAAEMNLLSLETNVNDVSPFKIYNPHYPQAEIKIKQLAAHTSGILDREQIYEKTYVQSKRVDTAALGAFLKDYLSAGGKYYDARNFDENEPGAAFNYSNIGAALAAYLIETKSGMTFADFTGKYVFAPLGIRNASWFYDEAAAKSYATLYDAKRQPLPVYSSINYPDGSLKISADDLAKYLNEIIKGDAGKGKILSAESFQTMLGKQFLPDRPPLKINPREPNQGVFFAHRANGQIGHTGSDFGVSVFMFFNPETRIGKIFITNIDIGEDKKLAAEFAGIWKTLEAAENNL